MSIATFSFRNALRTEKFMKIFHHKGVRYITAGWTFFTVENLVLSHNRTEIIDAIGESGYHTGYNTLSSCACLSIAYGYLRHGRGQGPILFSSPPSLRAARILSALCAGMGLIGMAQFLPQLRNPLEILRAACSSDREWEDRQSKLSAVEGSGASQAGSSHASTEIQTKPISGSTRSKSLCPLDFEADRAAAAHDGPYGIFRVTRHASLWSLAFLSLGVGGLRPRILATNIASVGSGLAAASGAIFASDFALFASPMIVIGILAWHKDHRHRNNIGGTIPEKMDWPYSSHIPFAACLPGLGGQQSFCEMVKELKPTNTVLAIFGVGLLVLRRGR